MPASSLTLPANQARAITWQQWPLRFQLECEDEAVAEKARAVFSHWNCLHAPTDEFEAVGMAVVREADTYAVTRPSGQVVRYADVDLVVRLLESDAAVALLDQHEKLLTVHGALLERDGKGVLILGPSQAGKSTLSCALWREGWSLLSDDITILTPHSREARPVHRRVSLRHPSRVLLGEELWTQILQVPSCSPSEEGYVFHPAEVDGTRGVSTVPLSAVICLGRTGAAPLEPAAYAPILPVNALLGVAPYTNLVRKTDLGTTMKALQPLLDRVPAFDLARGPLAEMIASVCAMAKGE